VRTIGAVYSASFLLFSSGGQPNWSILLAKPVKRDCRFRIAELTLLSGVFHSISESAGLGKNRLRGVNSAPVTAPEISGEALKGKIHSRLTYELRGCRLETDR
jgi:hypothetical protein